MDTFVEIPASKTSLAGRKPRYGVGINDANYITNHILKNQRLICPYYKVWYAMLERCYSAEYQKKHPAYVGCSVYTPWHTFSIFRSWMERQDWKDKALDKDMLVEGNKIYSPETCIFISQTLNNLLCLNNKKRGKYLLGVSKCSNVDMFRARCCDGEGKVVNLGVFKLEKEAHQAYCTYKASLLLKLADIQTDYRLATALRQRSKLIDLIA